MFNFVRTLHHFVLVNLAKGLSVFIFSKNQLFNFFLSFFFHFYFVNFCRDLNDFLPSVDFGLGLFLYHEVSYLGVFLVFG